MRRAVSLLVAVLLSLAFAPAPLPRRAPRDTVPSLEGAWVEFVTREGVRHDCHERMVFAGGEVRVHHPGNDYRGAYRADPRASPPALDMTMKDGLVRAIWKVEGDTLTFAYYRWEWGRRPTSFDAEGMAKPVYTYRRESR